ncbi:hypothetical protein JO972_05475 [Verrucomicrobiaceae bacterium 5K15]|uniref:Lipopolysaccharide heptosyltransferase II n=1 Tax=Oceaniferula flava TaxID=2800421 RepID=A0AAE2VBY0_9BACT|nr:glycosyltransferase family 9 protein [Oceaniferula flavus]MBK1854396.1 hypothetical protein [Oceaniferula flavus]MBM1135702.1 hypothetical protein [Oceaniferula flavus]
MAVLCPESQAPLWQSMEELDRVIIYPDKSSARQIAKLLQAQDLEFESSISWEANEAAKAFQRVSILQRLGYPAKGLEKTLTDPVSVVVEPGPIEHRVRHYLLLVEELGGNPFVKATFQTPELPAAPKKSKIALAPASDFGASHQWPVERFKELVESFEAEHGKDGIEWLILGSSQSGDIGTTESDLATLLDGRAKNHAAEWGMEENLTALASCTALLSSDNSLAHLAAHLGLPAVVVFGPNEPSWKRPLGKQSQALREHVACSPCFLPKCPLDMRCQDAVSVEMVSEALLDAMNDRAGESQTN